MSNIEIRPANRAEEWAYVPRPDQKSKTPHPEKSKYYGIWCSVESILLQGSDAIVDFTDNYDSDYSLTNVQNGLLKLARVFRSSGRIDFKIKTETIYLLEPIAANSDAFEVEGTYLQIRAIFEKPK